VSRGSVLLLVVLATLAAAGRAPAMVRPIVRAPSLASLEAAETERLLALGLPVYCGGHRTRYVGFTFDDGPGPYTAVALRILRHAGAQATFFLVGRNIAPRVSLTLRESRLGGVGDHTWTHPFLPALRLRAIDAQLAETKAALDRVARTTVTLFRPPYGAHDAAVDKLARRLGMVEVLWSVDSGDSEGARWRAIGATIARDVRPGAIVLMHDNRGQTIRALRFLILPWLHRRRLVPVGVSELLALDPPTLAQLRRGERACYAP
jgi:peptidoglycan-N-acetylglucosamine deacetylase